MAIPYKFVLALASAVRFDDIDSRLENWVWCLMVHLSTQFTIKSVRCCVCSATPNCCHLALSVKLAVSHPHISYYSSVYLESLCLHLSILTIMLLLGNTTHLLWTSRNRRKDYRKPADKYDVLNTPCAMRGTAISECFYSCVHLARLCILFEININARRYRYRRCQDHGSHLAHPCFLSWKG
jgi:hypothetical protein